MKTTYGAELTDIPEGFVKRIRFPQLMMLDEWTPDGRRIDREGFEVADLPLPVKLLDHDTEAGHLGSVIVGRLDQVTIEDNGLVHGVGHLLDDDAGRRAASMVRLKAINKNSVDLRDIEMKIKFPSGEDFGEDGEGFITLPKVLRRFSKAKLAGTTLVMVPAFPKAYAEIDEDEITAAWSMWDVDVVSPFDELAASTTASDVLPWDDFHIEEFDDPNGYPLTVDENDRVFGHLGLWKGCHTGFLDRCVRIPPSPDGYASFCSASVLTDNGLVRTGPIFLFNGHPRNARPEEIERAYGGAENAWADVRVVNGRHGPWMSGRVRPGVPRDRVAAARGSKVSGHWFNRNLFAVVSVNAPGFDVPYTYSSRGGDEMLVASFGTADCGCGGVDPLGSLASILLQDLADAELD